MSITPDSWMAELEQLKTEAAELSAKIADVEAAAARGELPACPMVTIPQAELTRLRSEASRGEFWFAAHGREHALVLELRRRLDELTAGKQQEQAAPVPATVTISQGATQYVGMTVEELVSEQERLRELLRVWQARATKAEADLERAQIELLEIKQFMESVRQEARGKNPQGATALDFLACWCEQRDRQAESLRQEIASLRAVLGSREEAGE